MSTKNMPLSAGSTARPFKPTLLVFGNQKGGSGKSTMALHVTIALLQNEYKVGTIDIDSRQGTFTRFLENRWNRVQEEGLEIMCPHHILIGDATAETITDRNQEDLDNLTAAFEQLTEDGCEIVVIDCPGSDTELSRLAHRFADVLVTPINDSFIDLDLIARIDGKTLEIQQPSIYSDAVWQYRKERAIKRGTPLQWFIVRNRLSHINAQNKQNIQQLLEKLEKRFAFTFLNGFSERVIYRELFLKGLTLMDLHKVKDSSMNMSQLSARQEVRALINALGFARGGVNDPDMTKTKKASKETVAA
ncbi:MAG TPA: division plane positioning ATPase MipZ [Alphaproteobacteria bacterium]